ncbi:MAG: hypothetical protein Q8P57_00490 [Candidatus Pacearchaeota archaeon]|nr:hypothetical protein [Candidatus Pacearchaeota archaeon]
MSKLLMRMDATSSTRGLLTLAIKISRRNEGDFLILISSEKATLDGKCGLMSGQGSSHELIV